MSLVPSSESNADQIFNDVKRKTRLRLQQIQRVTQFALLLVALDTLYIGRYTDAGVLLGTVLLIGYDSIVTDRVDTWIQEQKINPEGKSYLTITIGCTGGKHRSVALAEVLREHLARKGSNVSVTHRDLGKE